MTFAIQRDRTGATAGSATAGGRSTYSFADRHIGPRPEDVREMLHVLGLDSLDELIERTIPSSIRPANPPDMPAVGEGITEQEALARLRSLASRNKVFKSYIGMGYSDCFTPPVILRNLIEDPQWYTPYTPYQAEVSQGRLESLLNYQTMVMDLTGMEISNASLLDEATAAAEAMHMCHNLHTGNDSRPAFFVSHDCHPQIIAVLQTRAEPLGIEIVVGRHNSVPKDKNLFGGLISYPATDGTIHDIRDFIDSIHAAGGLAVVSADILALALITPPGEWGADIVIGNTQRFGVPLGYGGPHAAYMATKDAYKRQLPGRLVGVSRDAEGRPAVRLALQTREQHIRRDKATSNICTAQALLANVAAMFAVYHGPEGVREIARKVHTGAYALAQGLRRLGYSVGDAPYFDTVRISVGEGRARAISAAAESQGMNLRVLNSSTLTISVDETTTAADLQALLGVFGPHDLSPEELAASGPLPCDAEGLRRTSPYLTHPVFNRYHSETEMLRYLSRLSNKDISLANSMIPLGSCTMKLNATTEMIPITWPEFNRLHPFAPVNQVEGYRQLIRDLEAMLCDITGFAAVSLQPNAGSQGEYAGLLVIRKYHQSRGELHRNVCLIPSSAHGTNPASAAMAGMQIVVIKTDESGNIDVDDLRAKAEEHAADLSTLMITYPSTHGVFEESIREICAIVHRNGGQVYMDGANMNAQVGLCRPGDFGPDVCHLNLHKTFCIPHGGGGPGMGPIGAAAHLKTFLPSHPVVPMGGSEGIGAVAAAPWGSPSILPISYAYIAMMGTKGLRRATQVAILNANYVARRLETYFPVLYKGKNGLVAHECILDLRPMKSVGIEVEDVAKRLMDYGFHAPTVSFPVPGTMMIEPTESEPKEELDRFCDAMISIAAEVEEIRSGAMNPKDNVLKNAPHTAEAVMRDVWTRPYSREKAAFPVRGVRDNKYWPPVARIDNVYGDRNVMCACPPIESYS